MNMGVGTNAGSRLFIGPANNVADDVAEFEAATPYVEVGEVEDLGEFGDQVASQTFTAVGNRRVRKLKTTFDAGEMALVLGMDSGDAGQAALVAALDSDDDFAIKITINDEDESDSDAEPTTFYFRAKVMSNRRQLGRVDNIRRRAVTLAINSEIIEVEANNGDG
jgi:hypothetical protein